MAKQAKMTALATEVVGAIDFGTCNTRMTFGLKVSGKVTAFFFFFFQKRRGIQPNLHVTTQRMNTCSNCLVLCIHT